MRTLQAADIAGLQAIFVRAKDQDAEQLYAKHGFIRIVQQRFFRVSYLTKMQSGPRNEEYLVEGRQPATRHRNIGPQSAAS